MVMPLRARCWCLCYIKARFSRDRVEVIRPISQGLMNTKIRLELHNDLLVAEPFSNWTGQETYLSK